MFRLVQKKNIPATVLQPGRTFRRGRASLAVDGVILPSGDIPRQGGLIGEAPTISHASTDAIDVRSCLVQDFFNLNPISEAQINQGEVLKELDVEYPYWQKISRWQNVSKETFFSYTWQKKEIVQGEKKLFTFLNQALPDVIPLSEGATSHIRTRELFIEDVLEGMKAAPMSIRLMPHTLASIDWTNPIKDPVRLQFIPMKSGLEQDHFALTLDSLNEKADSPVDGLVHRYPDKGLFLVISACPTYCRYCTRSYAVGGNTESVSKASLKPIKRRWDECFEYIENTPSLVDIVVSGGDCFYLEPQQLYDIGKRLIEIPHIRRFRFASKGLAVCPSRFLAEDDQWAEALIAVSTMAKKVGKSVAMHTHFNHPNEISWVTVKAAQKLFEAGVTVRNQSVLLRGVNDNVETMKALIRGLGDINVLPYYVYQGDMVKGVEDLRTPLQTILDLEQQIRGSIAGFLVPSFVVDLPGGGGKRLAASYETYDRKTGKSTFVAPAITNKGNKVYEYYDPVYSLQT